MGRAASLRDASSHEAPNISRGGVAASKPPKAAPSASRKAATMAAMRNAAAFQSVRVSVSDKGARKTFAIPKARMLPQTPQHRSGSVEEASQFGNLSSIIPERRERHSSGRPDPAAQEKADFWGTSPSPTASRGGSSFSPQHGVPGTSQAQQVPAIVALPAEARNSTRLMESGEAKASSSRSAPLMTAAGFVRARFDSFARYTSSALQLGFSREQGSGDDAHLDEPHGAAAPKGHLAGPAVEAPHRRMVQQGHARMQQHTPGVTEADEAAYERAMRAKQLVQDLGKVVGVFQRLGLPETSWRNKMPYREPRVQNLARGLKWPEEQHFKTEAEQHKFIRDSRKLQPFMFGEIPSWSWLAADIGLFAFLTCNPRWPWSLN